jgi:hypothetical protein
MRRASGPRFAGRGLVGEETTLTIKPAAAKIVTGGALPVRARTT